MKIEYHILIFMIYKINLSKVIIYGNIYNNIYYTIYIFNIFIYK